ncbi:MAG: protein kinase, partial [Rhodobacterales bacterium]|nr:protein kinase [Rhodobacterales bacterium]
FTLMRRLGSDGATESYVAILDEPAGKQVVARHVESWLCNDPRLVAELESRARDLQAVRHSALIPSLEYQVVDGEHFVIDDWIEAVSLGQLLDHCRATRQPMPHNIFLHLATQICNGLEALHSRPASHSGAEHVLHLGLCPESVLINPEGRLMLGAYGLVRSLTIGSGGSGAGLERIKYLAPEQTHPDQPLAPSADVFALGAILYEMLMLRPLFQAASRLQVLHRIRHAEVTTQLLEIKETLPGLDKILYRSLSLNPRHRYQRAFVLREDLRGLMAGYNFAKIDEETKDFTAPLFVTRTGSSADEVMPQLPPFEGRGENTANLLNDVLELPQGFFEDKKRSGDDTASHLRPKAALQPIRTPDFAPSNTDALLRQTNQTDADDEITDVPSPGFAFTDLPNPNNLPPVRVARTPMPPPQRPATVPMPAPIAAAPPAPPAPEISKAPPPEPEPASAPASEPPPSPRSMYDDVDYTAQQNSMPWIATGMGISAVVVVAALCGLGGLWTLLGGPSVAAAPESTAQIAPSTEPAPTLKALEAPKRAKPQPSAAPQPSARRQAASVAPTPRPKRLSAPNPRIRSTPAPTPVQAVVAPAPTVTEPDDAFAQLEATVDAEPIPVELGELSQYAQRALTGLLTDSDRTLLEEVTTTDQDFTRAQLLLYQNAKATSSVSERERHMAAILEQPENHYRPEYLVEAAQLSLAKKDYRGALASAELAERHWARLPSDLIFTRKAAIYELEAAAHTGLFYGSDGEQTEQLNSALRDWARYRQHVKTKHRSDLIEHADTQIAKLQDIQERMQ